MPQLVSIVVPIYRTEKHLKKCVDSILLQTHQEIELILVDDESPDSCGQICDAYAKKDKRVVVIHKKNGGLSSARNEGIARATGDFIMFVDSDDYIDKNMVEVLHASLVQNAADLSMCNMLYVDESGNELERLNRDLPVKNECLTGEAFLSKLVDKKYVYYAVAWNKLYAKHLFERIKFPEGKIHEDEFVVHHIFYQCKRIASVENAMYYYVQRKNSIIQSKMSVRRLDGVEALYDRCHFAYAHQFWVLYYETLSISVGFFCKVYAQLDLRDVVVKKRVLSLKKQYNTLFWKSMKMNMPMKMRAKLTLWYVSATVYKQIHRIFKKQS